MKRLLSLAWLAAIALLAFSAIAQAQHAEYDVLVARHAKANAVPEALVHRVIVVKAVTGRRYSGAAAPSA